MPLFNKPQLQRVARSKATYLQKSASRILLESTKSIDPDRKFHIFLSHRYLDAEYILGLKTEIETLNYSVFVDWLENPGIDRSQVTKRTAAWLREMMDQCSCLFYAVSTNSSDSAWMPWELGYCDGKHGKVAIVPITDSQTTSESYFYQGQEYLGLYPYVTKTLLQNTDRQELWINQSMDVYVSFPKWLRGELPTSR